jgi:transcriptional regulator with XRE-family HTH domain
MCSLRTIIASGAREVKHYPSAATTTASTLGHAVSDGLAPKRFARARQEFWQAVQKRAGSRQAMVPAFNAAGFEVTESAVGRWVRGESDPGFEATAWAAEKWAVSIDAFVSGQALEAKFTDRLDDQGRRLGEVEGWLRELAAHMGMEIDGPATAPQLTYLRMQREVEELRSRVDRLLRQKEA